MNIKLLTPETYYYRYLKEKYPHNKSFYIEYDEGSYYDRSTTTFYGDDKKKLESKDNGYYG